VNRGVKNKKCWIGRSWLVLMSLITSGMGTSFFRSPSPHFDTPHSQDDQDHHQEQDLTARGLRVIASSLKLGLRGGTVARALREVYKMKSNSCLSYLQCPMRCSTVHGTCTSDVRSYLIPAKFSSASATAPAAATAAPANPAAG
jgi:hypothetical protein